MNYQNYGGENNNITIIEYNSRTEKFKKDMLDIYDKAHRKVIQIIKSRGSKRFKDILLDKWIPRAYKRAAKAPIDENKIVFVEIRHPHITNSFSVIFDELVNNYDYNIHTHFLLNGNTSRADYTKRCLNAIQDIATAKYVFLNEGSTAISAVDLRPETKIIQLWHGCGAFKKFGFSTADLIFGDTRKGQLRHPLNKNYSLVSVSSPEVIWAYKEAMNLPESSDIVKATGISRTDIFYNDEFISESAEHLYKIFPQAKGKKIILYAPTFRGRVARAQTPNMLNVNMFYEHLGDEYVLLFKHHPHVKTPPKINEKFKDFAMDVSNLIGIEELLCVADICISDYSSLVFEYSLFEKPIIFFAYDLDEYFDWRGFYYDYYELAPGLITKTNFEMIDYIKNIDTRFNKKAIQDFKYKFMRSCDGRSTQRILETMFDDLEKHRKPCEGFEHFYTVPKVENSASPYFKRIANIEHQKEAAAGLYINASKKKIRSGSIIALDIASNVIEYMLKTHGHDKIKFIKAGETLESVIEALSCAEYILIDRPSILLDSLKLRKETKVIYLPYNAFPLETFGKITKEFRSGLRKEQYELAPLFSNVDMIAAPSERTGKLFKTAFGGDVDILNIGDIKTDVLFDNDFKNAVFEKLYENHSDLKGRKVIAYISKYNKAVEDSLIYEYLHKDYVFIKCYIHSNRLVHTSAYYSDSIVDVSDILSVYAALAIADIVIGDFNAAVLSFMASSKPVFIYCPDSRPALLSTESFVDIESSLPSPIYENIMDIINAILNINSYDYTDYNKLKAEYLNNCDGSSTKRLISALS